MRRISLSMSVTIFICLLFFLSSINAFSQPPKPRKAGTTTTIITPELNMTIPAQRVRFSPNGEILAIQPPFFRDADFGLVIVYFKSIFGENAQLNEQHLRENVKLFANTNLGHFDFTPDGQLIAAVPYTGRHTADKIEFWNVYSRKLSDTITPNQQYSISGPLFTPNGNMFAYVSKSSPNSKTSDNIELRDTITLEHLRKLKYPSGGTNYKRIGTFALTPNGRQVLAAAVSSDKPVKSNATIDEVWDHIKSDTIELWDTSIGDHMRTLKIPTQREEYGRVKSLVFIDDEILVGHINYFKKREHGSQYKVVLWSPQTGKHLKTLTQAGKRLETMAISPDGRFIATTLHGKTTSKFASTEHIIHGPMNVILLWESYTGALVRTLHSPAGEVSSVVFSPNGLALAAVGGIDEIPIWNPHTGKLLTTLKHDIELNQKGGNSELKIVDVAFSLNNQIVVGAVETHTLIWILPEDIFSTI